MGIFRQHPLTLIASLVILATIIFAQFSQRKWEDPNNVISGDVRGYYAYLPAFFIYDDIELQHNTAYNSENGTRIWYMVAEDGTRYVKYTCGMAILYSPFFLAAHALAEPMGHVADGFSLPYRFALAMSAIFYLLLALIFLSKLLRRYFSDHVVAATLLIIFVGTNALHYYTGNMTYSHGYSLALISMFLYYSVCWLEKPGYKYAVLIGLSAGLMVLVRPVDIIFLLALPLLNTQPSLQSLKERFGLFFRNWKQIILMVLVSIIVFIPQFLYNSVIFGELFHYSYTNESFFFGHPHILDSMFSFRNGWLIYSPLMILSLVGLFFPGKARRTFGMFLFPVLALYIYVLASWWCWWYVGFGNRAYINLYPLLAIPLAAFIQYVYSKRWIHRALLNLLILCGLTLSTFQTWQYDHWTLHWGAMTREAYMDSFFRTRPSQLFETYLRYPVDHKQLEGIDAVYEPTQSTIYTRYYSYDSANACDSAQAAFLQFDVARHGKGALKIDEGMEFIGDRMPVYVKGADAMYISAWVKDLPEEMHITLSKTEPVFFYRSSDEAYTRNGDWQKVHLFCWIPDNLGTDSLDFLIWNQGKHAFYLDDLSIKALRYTYEEKER